MNWFLYWMKGEEYIQWEYEYDFKTKRNRCNIACVHSYETIFTLSITVISNLFLMIWLNGDISFQLNSMPMSHDICVYFIVVLFYSNILAYFSSYLGDWCEHSSFLTLLSLNVELNASNVWRNINKWNWRTKASD